MRKVFSSTLHGVRRASEYANATTCGSGESVRRSCGRQPCTRIDGFYFAARRSPTRPHNTTQQHKQHTWTWGQAAVRVLLCVSCVFARVRRLHACAAGRMHHPLYTPKTPPHQHRRTNTQTQTHVRRAARDWRRGGVGLFLCLMCDPFNYRAIHT